MQTLHTQSAGIAGTQHLPRLLSIREVQSVIGGKSRSTLYRWIASGQFPRSVKIGGNSVAWTEESILAWRESLMSQEVA